MPLRINGMLHYLWQAVDQHGVVPDILVHDWRDGSAAKRFFRCLLAALKYMPRLLITDGLKSHAVAQRKLLHEVRHRSSRYLNNRAENSHRPTRWRNWQIPKLKLAEQAQRFLSAHSMIYGHFHPRRHLLNASGYQHARNKAFRVWLQKSAPRRHMILPHPQSRGRSCPPTKQLANAFQPISARASQTGGLEGEVEAYRHSTAGMVGRISTPPNSRSGRGGGTDRSSPATIAACPRSQQV